MDVTVWRTSRSTIVRELLDYSTAIFDRDGWNVAQAARIPSHLNSMSYFLTEILARHHAARSVAAGRHCHLQRSLLRRPASAGHRRLQGGVPGWPAHRLRRHAVPSSGCRRVVAGQLRLERHRDLPGRPAHPAGEAVRGRQAGRADPRHHPAERAPAGIAVGGPAVADRLAQCRRGEYRAAGAQAWRGALRAGVEAAAGCVGGRHARRDQPHSRRHLRVRGRHRRRRHHRSADPHPCQGDRGRRRDDRRSVGLQRAVAGAEQCDARVHVFHRVLRADGDGGRAGAVECRLLPAGERSSRRRAVA